MHFPLRFVKPYGMGRAEDARRDVAQPWHAGRVASMPKIVWIELTSRCPYDCIFCSRSLRRGHGVNMSMETYRRIVADLDRPEIVRLNYSGESTHHPHIVEAVALAAATGAWVELVSVPAALHPRQLEDIVHAGLNRLTVSLHTLDPSQFKALYGFGDLARLLTQIRASAALRETSKHPFALDLAFVAMARNLDQLPAVVALAAELAIPVVNVHPVLRRDQIPEQFDTELDGEATLTPGFGAEVARSIDRVRHAHPEVRVDTSLPGADRLGRPLAPSKSARPQNGTITIHCCDQDPFETVHILADGTVVTCEVRDQHAMGGVATTALRDIWHGERFTEFRASYAVADDLHCRTCAYRQSREVATLGTSVSAHENTAQLLRGWHSLETSIVWSKKDAVLVLRRSPRARMLVLEGLLPGSANHPNEMTITVDGAHGARITQSCAENWRVRQNVILPTPSNDSGSVTVRLEVSRAHVPACGRRRDTRELGFALISAAVA